MRVTEFDIADFSQLAPADQREVAANHLGRAYFMDVEIGGVRLPNEPLVRITQQKSIVETVVVGSDRRGTVKELVGAEDFRISITGVCIDPTRDGYPEVQVKEIIDLCSRNEALDIDCYLTSLFGVERVVVKSYGFDEMPGKSKSQKYSMELVSDEDFLAEVNLDGL